MTASRWAVCLAGSCALALAGAQCACAAEEPEESFRYEFRWVGSKCYRTDRKTGRVELVVLPTEATAKADETPAEGARTDPLKRPAKNHQPVILNINGQPGAGSPVDALAPKVILDADRERAALDIQGYRGQLGIIQLLSLANGRIKGTITVSNRGPSKLETLELTLFAKSAKQAEPVAVHRIVLGWAPGQTPPPTPPPDSTRRPAAVFLPVDIPSPQEGLTKFDVQPTFLRFTD